MGRATFEPALEVGVADPSAHLDTDVRSTTLDPALHPAVTVVATDPVALVRDRKRVDGTGIWLCGGGRLAATLVDEVDRLVVKPNLVTFGAGRPLLDGAYDPRSWRPEASRTLDLGVVLLSTSVSPETARAPPDPRRRRR